MTGNHKLSSHFEDLARRIREKSGGKTVVYISNPGNYGDGLIRYATKAFFYDYNITHYEVSVSQPLWRFTLLRLAQKWNPVFLYGGGGAWCENFNSGYKVCRYLSWLKRKLVVLPTTYGFSVEDIRGILHRRDDVSSKEKCPDSFFCPDMALYLAVQDKRDYRSFPILYDTHCNAFRTDKESRGRPLPEGNIDFSAGGDHLSSGDDFIRMIAAYPSVSTDRLHVCIAAALAGRRVELYPGNYPKIRDIYESSLRDCFPHVTYHGEE